MRNNDPTKRNAVQVRIAQIDSCNRVVGSDGEFDGHAPESARAMSDTICLERTVGSELGGLHDLPGAARLSVGYKRDVKADGLSLKVEAGENDIALDSIDKRIACRPPVVVC